MFIIALNLRCYGSVAVCLACVFYDRQQKSVGGSRLIAGSSIVCLALLKRRGYAETIIAAYVACIRAAAALLFAWVLARNSVAWPRRVGPQVGLYRWPLGSSLLLFLVCACN